MDLFSEFFNEIWNDFDMMGTQIPVREERKCKCCSRTLSDFRKTGKFGCGECYNTFRAAAESALRQIHSNSSHTGKIPSRSAGELKQKRMIEELKKELSQAVKAEDYEKAAKLHKEIKKLEKGE